MSFSDLDYDVLMTLAARWPDMDDQQRESAAEHLDVSAAYLRRMLDAFRSFDSKRTEAAQRRLDRLLGEIPETPALESISERSEQNEPPADNPITLPPTPEPASLLPGAVPDYPESPSPVYEDFAIVGGDVMVSSDLEIPDQDVGTLRLMTAVAMQFGIKTWVIAGDFLAFDQRGLTPWGDPYRQTAAQRRHYREMTAYRSIRMGRDVIREAFKWFDSVFYLMGNHDLRLAKYAPFDMLDMLEEMQGEHDLTVSDYNYVYVRSPRGPWLIPHPLKGTSKVPASMTRGLYAVEKLPDVLRKEYGNTKPHIMSTHTHIYSVTTSDDDMRMLIEIGCHRDGKRTKYKQLAKTKHRPWHRAFGMIRNGYGYALSVRETDWELWLRPELLKWARSEDEGVAA